MSWTLLIVLACVLLACLGLLLERDREWKRILETVDVRREARAKGTHKGRLQLPRIDLSRCLGCGACVRACPEEQVLDIVHGQAMVIHGSRCVGHRTCVEECPVDAVTVELVDLDQRRDIPVLDSSFGVPTRPGLYLAGEVTGFALVKTAISQGRAVVADVLRHHRERPGSRNGEVVLDLCVVGAGPAGLACSMAAREAGLDFLTIEQATLGGTVATYPRRKLVLTQPVELPLGGRLSRSEYTKEDLIDLWSDWAREHELPIREGVRMNGLAYESGRYRLSTSQGDVLARQVVLALGRRGTPRKLGVDGEELPKVLYSLLDARSYAGRKLLVVGGGDSAIEAALALSEQVDTTVHLSYRKEHFFRLKPANERRLDHAIATGKLVTLMASQVVRIERAWVEIEIDSDPGRRVRIENDEVFVFAGGEPPFPMLEAAGVSFDPAERESEAQVGERGSGLVPALFGALAAVSGALGFAFWHRDYYASAVASRPLHPAHELFAPGATVGVAFGITAFALMLANLAYLLRRSPRIPVRFGSLKHWMTVHVGTGIGALVLAHLHAAMKAGDSMGGHALLGFLLLALTGAIGRYFYALVPRATNGRELELEDVQAELANISGAWDREQRGLGEDLLREGLKSIRGDERRTGFLGRLLGVLRRGAQERRILRDLRLRAREAGLAEGQIRSLLELGRRAVRAQFAVLQLEELRGLLASWRYFHRWGALLVVLLVVIHVVFAYRYGGVRW